MVVWCVSLHDYFEIALIAGGGFTAAAEDPYHSECRLGRLPLLCLLLVISLPFEAASTAAIWSSSHGRIEVNPPASGRFGQGG